MTLSIPEPHEPRRPGEMSKPENVNGKLSLPKTGYGGLLQRVAQQQTLQTPLMEILRDNEIIVALSRTGLYGGLCHEAHT